MRGFDVTCSAPKSVSVLFALGDSDTRREVLAAHDAAVAALAGWIERHAHTRYRIGGEVAIVDAEGIVAAAFRQHTSRALDPQLHTHLVIPNRVTSPDGRWLALDARLIKHDQQSLSAIYHAGLRAELTDRLGVALGATRARHRRDPRRPRRRARRVLHPHRRRCDGGSTPSSTASSTPWAATRPPGSDGGSSEKQRWTAGPRKPTRRRRRAARPLGRAGPSARIRACRVGRACCGAGRTTVGA